MLYYIYCWWHTLKKHCLSSLWFMEAFSFTISKLTCENYFAPFQSPPRPHETLVKKGSFLYSAVSSPLDPSKRFTLVASTGRPVHSDTNSASPGSILARQQITFPTLSIYSWVNRGHQWRERKCPIFETVTKRDSNPGSLDCESGILPLSYHAPGWHRRWKLPYKCSLFLGRRKRPCANNYLIWE